MWETINDVLTSKNSLQVILAILAILVIIVLLIQCGTLRVKTRHISLGTGDSDKERTIIREQCEWAHRFIEGLYGKISTITPELKCNGYFAKYVLELVYSEIVKWITINHLDRSEAYIAVKQDKIANIVYSMDIAPEYKTKEFRRRMNRWVEEVIYKLIAIRRLYS